MKFKLLKNKEKSHKNTADSNSAINERTREKFILKGWIESNRKPTCTNATRGFLFGSQTPFKRDFSLGRSMVEMLGVLAIIGVLSIGGIQGYTVAMRKYRANEILRALNEYAIILYTQCRSPITNSSYDSDNDIENDELYNCNPTPLSFLSAGLGSLPNGIKEPQIVEPYYLKKTNSGDIIWLYIAFEDKELCQTVLNTVGTQIPQNAENVYGSCAYDRYHDEQGYIGFVYFIMN